MFDYLQGHTVQVRDTCPTGVIADGQPGLMLLSGWSPKENHRYEKDKYLCA